MLLQARRQVVSQSDIQLFIGQRPQHVNVIFGHRLSHGVNPHAVTAGRKWQINQFKFELVTSVMVY
jgi:hypothetical protein